VVSLLTVQYAVRTTCGYDNPTEERSTNFCHCDEVGSAMAAGKASEHCVIHAKERQCSEVSWMGLQGKQPIGFLEPRERWNRHDAGLTHSVVII